MSTYTREDILAILPHRPPFLFVDRVKKLQPDKTITTEFDILEEAPWFAGHFPGKAVMPGVLVTDALAQTSGLLWGLSKKAADTTPDTEPEIFFLAAANMKYTSPSFPGDTLRMTAQSDTHFGSFFTYVVEAAVKRKIVAKGTLTLAMMEETL